MGRATRAGCATVYLHRLGVEPHSIPIQTPLNSQTYLTGLSACLPERRGRSVSVATLAGSACASQLCHVQMAHAAMAPSLLLANGHESAGIDKAKWLEATPPGEPHVACAAMRLHSVIQGQFEAL